MKKPQTLEQALFLARSGESKNLALAAGRMDGAIGQGQREQALDDITYWLPHRSDRTYSIQEFIEATKDRKAES